MSQFLHAKGSFPVKILITMFACKCFLCKGCILASKFLSLFLHLKGFSSVRILPCLWKSFLSFSQLLHVKGFSLVWVLPCHEKQCVENFENNTVLAFKRFFHHFESFHVNLFNTRDVTKGSLQFFKINIFVNFWCWKLFVTLLSFRFFTNVKIFSYFSQANLLSQCLHANGLSFHAWFFLLLRILVTYFFYFNVFTVLACKIFFHQFESFHVFETVEFFVTDLACNRF